MSNIYVSQSSQRPRPSRPPSRKMSRRRFYTVLLLIVVGGLMVISAGIAVASIILHGRGELNAPAATGNSLQVSNIRLSTPLTPGGKADLLFSVRNPNAYGARVDQVTLVGALRKANPAGCTSKVSGPITKASGYHLPAADQVLVGAGAKRNVVVRAAFQLAGSAKTGCGFSVVVDVSATQLPPVASPTTTKPAPPATPATTKPPIDPTTQPVTTPPTTPAQATPPPVAGGEECDPADPDCPTANPNITVPPGPGAP
jgi:hypothetical protein